MLLVPCLRLTRLLFSPSLCHVLRVLARSHIRHAPGAHAGELHRQRGEDCFFHLAVPCTIPLGGTYQPQPALPELLLQRIVHVPTARCRVRLAPCTSVPRGQMESSSDQMVESLVVPGLRVHTVGRYWKSDEGTGWQTPPTSYGQQRARSQEAGSFGCTTTVCIAQAQHFEKGKQPCLPTI